MVEGDGTNGLLLAWMNDSGTEGESEKKVERIPNSIGVIRFLVKARYTNIFTPHVLFKLIAPTSPYARVLHSGLLACHPLVPMRFSPKKLYLQCG